MAGWPANREIGIKFKTSALASPRDLMSGILFEIFDVRNFICDIWCQIFNVYRCICLFWCLRYLSLEIVSGHPPFLKNQHSTPWSTFLARQNPSVSPYPYKVLNTFLMLTLFWNIWFSPLLLVHLSLSLEIVPKGKVPSLSIFVLTFWKLKAIVLKFEANILTFLKLEEIVLTFLGLIKFWKHNML